MPDTNAPVEQDNLDSDQQVQQDLDSTRTSDTGPNWENQYNELRSDYTRKTQALSEYEQLFGAIYSEDQELRNQALEILGLTSPPKEQEQVDDDPIAKLEQRFAQLESQLQGASQASEQEQAIEAEVEYLDQQFTALEKKLGRNLSPEEVKVYASVAVNNPDEQGKPSLEAAHQVLQGLNDQTIESYRTSKQAPTVPGGTPDIQEVDMNDPDSRTRFMADYVRASREQ